MSEGDRLIQELASALMSSGLDALSETPIRKTGAIAVPPGLDAPCRFIARRGQTCHIKKLKVGAEPVLGVTSLCLLPTAGVFCPYCIAGGACAFHRPAALYTENHKPSRVHVADKLADGSDKR